MAKQVTCDTCRRSFLVPDEIGDFGVVCPYCEKLNPRARQDIQKASERRGTFLGLFGLVLLVPGIFGGIFGAFFCVLAIGNDGVRLTWPAILLISSILFIVAGSLLIHADSEGGFRKVGWLALGVVVFAVVVGVCGWIVIVNTCRTAFRVVRE